MRKLVVVAVFALFLVANVVITPTAMSIDLEPGECYQFTRSSANSCGGYCVVTYEACMDEYGQLHTEFVSAQCMCT